ncbi:MAG: hypothetical protein LBJ13_01975 [Puniceicoccales bacterium]|jgi:hypothetical protein|nr:hypothetical protein [Puniceicoccales bacterium]
MKTYWLRSICFFAFINFYQYVEGRRSMHKNPGEFSELHAIKMDENAKEIRHFSKIFRKQQRYNKEIKINKRFQKSIKFTQKEFNMHTLNRPFVRRMRSAKIGTAPLYQLPNANK